MQTETAQQILGTTFDELWRESPEAKHMLEKALDQHTTERKALVAELAKLQLAAGEAVPALQKELTAALRVEAKAREAHEAALARVRAARSALASLTTSKSARVATLERRLHDSRHPGLDSFRTDLEVLYERTRHGGDFSTEAGVAAHRERLDAIRTALKETKELALVPNPEEAEARMEQIRSRLGSGD